MILLVALAMAMVLALVMGGSLRRLPHLGLRCGWVMVIAFLAQLYAIYFPADRGSAQFAIAGAILTGSYVTLLYAVWRNGHLLGMQLVGLGLLLNLVVIGANGGYMPISPDALVQAGLQKLSPGLELGVRVAQTKDVLLLREETRLWFLSDIFVLAAPGPLRSIFSLGDVAIAAGAFVLVHVGTGASFGSRMGLPGRRQPLRVQASGGKRQFKL